MKPLRVSKSNCNTVMPILPISFRSGGRKQTGFRAIHALCLMFSMLCWGCALFTGGPRERVFDSDATRVRYDQLRAVNADLSTLRGVGSILFRHPGQAAVSERVAFTLQPPNRVRIAIRAVTGLPLVTLAADGEWIYLIDHRENRYHKKRFQSDALESVVGLSIGPGDLIDLLCGRLPAIDFDQAEGGFGVMGSENRIILKKRWSRTVYRVDHAGSPAFMLTGVERLGRDGGLKWRAKLSEHRRLDAYHIPAHVRLEGGNGTVLSLSMDRETADLPVDPALFRLKPPGHAS